MTRHRRPGWRNALCCSRLDGSFAMVRRRVCPVLKTLFPGELQLGLAQAAVAALAALLVVVAARRRRIHLEKELMIAMARGVVQIVAVGSILLLLLRAPDWTGVLLLVSMIVAAGATSA